MASRSRRLLRLVLALTSHALFGLAVLSLLAWVVGRVVSDRYAWSQWLQWIPTAALGPVVIAGVVGALGPGATPRRHRRRVQALAVASVLLLLYFVAFEHRFLRAAPNPGRGLSVVHWNMTHFRTGEEHDAHVAPLLRVLGDVNLLIDAYGLRRSPQLLDSLPEGYWTKDWGRLTVLTRVPILELRPIAMSDEGTVFLLRVDTTAESGVPLTMYVVDLPSDPRVPRRLVAKHVRAVIDEAELPSADLVIGDFNMTRGSASVARMFPDHRDAFDAAGHGYAASYHRRFPLHHIDLTLVADSMRCTRYDLIDPGMGRHLIQRAYVVPRD